ncbi:unnamed protein product [Prorocentrum cordatum]|uniref:Transmembrane protein n=1 Tax=Prorocentrum cordatum TaxID=2364126 RepID=A0ABN9UTJ3_9DINO|nr:unnamed protein product [Polarella glacialis]
MTTFAAGWIPLRGRVCPHAYSSAQSFGLQVASSFLSAAFVVAVVLASPCSFPPSLNGRRGFLLAEQRAGVCPPSCGRISATFTGQPRSGVPHRFSLPFLFSISSHFRKWLYMIPSMFCLFPASPRRL